MLTYTTLSWTVVVSANSVKVLLADLHAELGSHLSLLGNWQADQFTYIIHTPTFREVIMVKIVRIIIA